MISTISPKMKRYYLLLFSLLFVIQGTVLAVHPTVRNYDRKVSNVGTQNWDIIQHKNNWMYFANNKGLVEFDGTRWSIYPIRNYTNVRSLYYDEKADKIYAGAFNEFGFYSRNEAGLLQYHSLIEKINSEERNFNEIWHISKIEDAMYFQGDHAVFRFQMNRMIRFPFKNKIDYSAVVHNSLIVSSTPDGPSILNGNIFMRLPNSEILRNKKVCAILPFKKTKILFVTDFYGLYVFDGEKVEAFKTDIDAYLSENQVFCATLHGTKLAFGTVRNGLMVKDLNDNANIFLSTFSGLQNNTILSLHFDNQENLWLGLDKGIDYVLINSPIYDLFGNSQLIGAGYSSLIRRNVLYLGTNQGLYVTAFPIPNSPNQLDVKLINKMQGQVWSLAQIDNTLFCGTDHGAFIINDGKAEQLEGIPGTWGFRKLRTKPDIILGSSYQGFFILKKNLGKWQFSNFIKGFSESGGMFEEDDDGRIWFNHWIKGISRLTLNEKLDGFSMVEPYGTTKGFPSNRDNTLFRISKQITFSTQNGFYTFNRKSDQIERSSQLEGLFGVPSHSMHLNQSNKGDIWCTSNTYVGAAFKQGKNTFNVDTLSFCTLKFKLISGFEHFNFLNDSTIIVSTEDGFSWLDLSKTNKKKSQFKISIRNVYLTSETDSVVRGFEEVQNKDKIPVFNFNQNSLRFEYVATEFRNEGSVTYSYLLENYDSKWSSYSTINSKEYTKLRKGSYIFRVKAKSLLEAKPIETSYQFVILPPWYESNAALVVYFLLIVLLIFKLISFIKIRSEKGAREMKVQKELEMLEQEMRYQADTKEKKKEIIELKNQRLQYDLRHKSQELASSTMNLIRKNEILLDINQNLIKVSTEISENSEPKVIQKKILKMQDAIKQNLEHDNNWKRFSENFDLVYENYLKRLSETYPQLTISDKKLCAYLKMDLSSKDIAPLLNMSFRSVEMSRYRLRKKMNLDRTINLSDFLQNI